MLLEKYFPSCGERSTEARIWMDVYGDGQKRKRIKFALKCETYTHTTNRQMPNIYHQFPIDELDFFERWQGFNLESQIVAIWMVRVLWRHEFSRSRRAAHFDILFRLSQHIFGNTAVMDGWKEMRIFRRVRKGGNGNLSEMELKTKKSILCVCGMWRVMCGSKADFARAKS